MSWIDGPEYDAWKTTPPEPNESGFRCDWCKCQFYVGDEYYDIDDEILCPDCAKEWLEEHRMRATDGN